MGRLLAAGQLWQELQLDRFWADRLPPSRKRTRWDQVLQVLATYRLIAPGSEWRLHREWFGNSAMADLLGADFGLAEEHKLYACHDRLLEHKDALFSHLVGRWRYLFNADFDVLLYDLTSTYFEVNASGRLCARSVHRRGTRRPLRLAERTYAQTTRVPWADVSDLNRGNATLRPAKRTRAQLVGGLDSRGDSLKTAGTNTLG